MSIAYSVDGTYICPACMKEHKHLKPHQKHLAKCEEYKELTFSAQIPKETK